MIRKPSFIGHEATSVPWNDDLHVQALPDRLHFIIRGQSNFHNIGKGS